jgi:hypothetical protein
MWFGKTDPSWNNFWSPFQRWSLLMGNHKDEKQEEDTKREIQSAIFCSSQFWGMRSKM